MVCSQTEWQWLSGNFTDMSYVSLNAIWMRPVPCVTVCVRVEVDILGICTWLMTGDRELEVDERKMEGSWGRCEGCEEEVAPVSESRLINTEWKGKRSSSVTVAFHLRWNFYLSVQFVVAIFGDFTPCEWSSDVLNIHLWCNCLATLLAFFWRKVNESNWRIWQKEWWYGTNQ